MSANPNSYYDESGANSTLKSSEQSTFDAQQRKTEILQKIDDLFGEGGEAFGGGLGRYLNGKVSEHVEPLLNELIKDLDGIIVTTQQLNVNAQNNMSDVANVANKTSQG